MWVLVILIFPFAVLYEIVKMNEQSHHRGKRKRRKDFNDEGALSHRDLIL